MDIQKNGQPRGRKRTETRARCGAPKSESRRRANSVIRRFSDNGGALKKPAFQRLARAKKNAAQGTEISKRENSKIQKNRDALPNARVETRGNISSTRAHNFCAVMPPPSKARPKRQKVL
ncbi:MAG: hypothetical protein DBX55_02220 [Verrucomicrobia bacterium]|nr:MAG: hypothetical protein DBX55_02220 [Verrucomicrobiota bacterium]